MSRSFLFVALAAGLLAAPAQAAVLVTIDKSAQQMTVEVDGRPLYQWPVSTGKGGYDTPSGKFKAFRMERDHFSKEWDRSEEHTSELQSLRHLVCRLLLEKKKTNKKFNI